MNRLVYWIYRVLGLIPLLWSTSVILIHFYVVNETGFNPTYDNPVHIESKWIWDSGIYLLILYIVSIYCFFLFIGLFFTHLILKITKKVNINLYSILISSIGLIIAIIVNYIPMFNNTLSWLWD